MNVPRDGSSDLLYDASVVSALLCGYAVRYRNVEFSTISVEQFLQAKVVDPHTNKRVNGWRNAGKIDALLKINGQTVLMDHKTTSESIEDEGYWSHLRIDGQASHYLILLLQNGASIDSILWDVLKKPTIRQKQTESLNDFSKRLIEDCINVRPDYYFGRRIVPQLSDIVLAYAEDLPKIAKQMRAAMDGWSVPPKSTGSCFMYNKRCKFLPLCTGEDQESNWIKKPKKHAELPDGADNYELLTHSRIRTFQACQRKHHYEYVAQLKHPDEPEDAALRFGTLWHLALETYMGHFKEGAC